jgi:isopenicillin N synthase-like dioxygenase
MEPNAQGFFYVKNHGIKKELVESLFSIGHTFFEQDVDEKMKIEMKLAGNAFRGYFKVQALAASIQVLSLEGS